MTTATHAPSTAVAANRTVVAHLEEIADLLEAQGANVFRVRAYRNAAESIRTLDRPAMEIFQAEGIDGLDALPHVGSGIARVIRDVLLSGRNLMLDRLRGAADPVAILETVPGLGRVLAQRLHDEAGIDSLEELESAAHDGRLAQMSGFGTKRTTGIRDALATRLGRSRRATAALGGSASYSASTSAPPIADILAVDREYREAAQADRLPRIAPRRFNPTGAAWLPVLHTTRGGRHYTVLFSNTAQAHQLARTHDWVVIYFDGADGEHQHTVVTARAGELAGQRVVRGRERECEAYYARHSRD